MSSEYFFKLFKNEEISQIQQMASCAGKVHPIKSIVFPADKNEIQAAVNTEYALKHILKSNPDWYAKIKPRLLLNNYAESASALSEIRAYGYLLETNLSVEPVPVSSTSTHDFLIKNRNGERVRVEVHAKQYDNDVVKNLEKFQTESVPAKKGVICRLSDPIAPLGKPKAGENVTENAISRLCGIKKNEEQLSETDTSILWLDFQDNIWWLLEADNVFPIRSWRGGFYSGVIWYAFYGFKGAPIFETYSEANIRTGELVKMRHEGRFRQKTKIDAVIITFPKNTLILENPDSKKQIKSWLVEELTQIPWFSYEYSYLTWPGFDLKRHIKSQHELICAFAALKDKVE